VLILTGHLLKDPDFTLKFHRGDLFKGTPYEKEAETLVTLQKEPLVLEPTADAVVRVLQAAEKK
jgi:threonine synthase